MYSAVVWLYNSFACNVDNVTDMAIKETAVT